MKLLVFVPMDVYRNLFTGQVRQKFSAEIVHMVKIKYLTHYFKLKLSVNKLVIHSTQEFRALKNSSLVMS